VALRDSGLARLEFRMGLLAGREPFRHRFRRFRRFISRRVFGCQVPHPLSSVHIHRSEPRRMLPTWALTVLVLLFRALEGACTPYEADEVRPLVNTRRDVWPRDQWSTSGFRDVVT